MSGTIDAAAHEAATSDLNLLRKPSQAQAEAGNYKKGHLRVAGLDIAIENPAGSRRKPEWPPMQAHYGYIKRTEAADGDAVDVFVRPGTTEDWSGDVYVVDQMIDGQYDEAKVMLGYDSTEQAMDAYMAHFTDDWEEPVVTAMNLEEFKAWLRDGDTTQPVGKAWTQPTSPTSGIAPYGGARPNRKKRVRLRPGVKLTGILKA